MAIKIWNKHGHEMTIDEDRLELINKHKSDKYWCFEVNRGYAKVTRYRKHCQVHHLIIGKPINNLVVDHINGDKLDNRVKNLRIITISENNRNIKPKGASKYLGVHWCKTGKDWVANCRVNRKKKYLGHFKTEQAAARAYDRFCIENNLITRLNFPEEVA